MTRKYFAFCAKSYSGEIRVGSYKGIRGGAVGPSAVYGEPEGRGTGAGAHEEVPG